MKLKFTMKTYRIWIPILIGVFVATIPFFPSIRIDKSVLDAADTEIIDVSVSHTVAKPQQLSLGMPALVQLLDPCDVWVDRDETLPVDNQVRYFFQRFRNVLVVRAP